MVRFPRVIANASRARRRIRAHSHAYDSTADETFSTRRSLAQQGKHDEEDARDASRARQFTDEERRWFYEAMESGLVNEVSKMKEDVETLRRGAGTTSTDDEDAIERALEDLIERVESVDNAGDLHAIGGMEALVGTLTRERATIRAAACEALATTTQNHPEAQRHAVEAGVIGALVNVVERDGSDEVRAKGLYALSCVVRGCEEARRAFSLGGGARACARLIGHPGAERVRVKALTLGKHVFTQSEGDMASAIEFGAVPNAAACLASDDVNCREAAARVLLDIARCVDFEKYPKAVDDFRSQGTIARIARARETIAGMKDPDDVDANSETKVALDALDAMLA